MRTSARNSYAGVVEAVIDGAVNVEVLVKVTDTLTLTAIVTRESVGAMELKAGVRACGLVKAQHVILAVD